MRDTTDRLLQRAQEAGAVRADLDPDGRDAVAHGVVVATEHTPDQADRMLAFMLDGLRART